METQFNSIQLAPMISQEQRAILQSFLSMKPGTNYRAEWERVCKVKANAPYSVSKRVSAIVRAGITYDNQKTVQGQRASGELPAENPGMSWGEWLIFPLLKTHKGKLYLRFYPASFPGAIKRAFVVDGQAVEKESVAPYLYASELQDKSGVNCFDIKLDNLISFGKA